MSDDTHTPIYSEAELSLLAFLAWEAKLNYEGIGRHMQRSETGVRKKVATLSKYKDQLLSTRRFDWHIVEDHTLISGKLDGLTDDQIFSSLRPREPREIHERWEILRRKLASIINSPLQLPSQTNQHQQNGFQDYMSLPMHGGGSWPFHSLGGVPGGAIGYGATYDDIYEQATRAAANDPNLHR